MKIVKIPFGGGGLGKGDLASEAPDKIVKALENFFSDEDGKKHSYEVSSVEVDNSNVGESLKNIYEKLLSFDTGIILGGDHSITYATFKAFVDKHPGAGLLVFDAHPDVEDDFSPPTQEDYLKLLVEEGLVDPSKVILVGLRNWHDKEIQYLKEKNIQYYSMKNIYEHEIKNICDVIMEKVRAWPYTYISIDIDVVDPAYAPGTGWCEPGGLSSRELIYFVQRLKLLKNLKVIDIVEVQPAKDVNELTVNLAAKIIKEASP